jgi:uncharacterized coiled-coil DUF342 family protein
MNTNVEQYISEKREQLHQLEQRIEQRAHVAGDKLHTGVDAWRTKRDEIAQKLDALRHDTTDRFDVLRMGFESAWAELKAAFETAMESKDGATEH